MQSEINRYRFNNLFVLGRQANGKADGQLIKYIVGTKCADGFISLHKKPV